jgi:hypothetical protein
MTAQNVMIGLYALNFIASVLAHGKTVERKITVQGALINTLISANLLAWGGFWK